VWFLMIFPGVLGDMGKEISIKGWRPHILDVLCMEKVKHRQLCCSVIRSDVSESMMQYRNDPELLVILGVAKGPLGYQQLEDLETEIKLGKQWQTEDEVVVEDLEAKSEEKGGHAEDPVVAQLRDMVDDLKRQNEERKIREIQQAEMMAKMMGMLKMQEKLLLSRRTD
ncbi:hypothetical protein MKW92_035655, partial [Papaver armeniacum]